MDCTGSTADHCFDVTVISFDDTIFLVLLTMVLLFVVYWAAKFVLSVITG